MNPVLRTKTFWQPYLTLESGDVSESDFAAQLSGLGRDFSVRDETVEYEHAGHRHTALHRAVEFPFFCGDSFSVIVEYEPNIGGCSRNLFLTDVRSGTRSEMGWWDQARWHPYCLRPDELESLLQFWARWDRRWEGQELPLLLLCQFVGLPDSVARDALVARVGAACRTLGLPEIGDGQPFVPLHIAEDYRWEADEELGWVFTSDEYCCYSIRNRPHADSDEGRFPFAAFREMMTQVQRQLKE